VTAKKSVRERERELKAQMATPTGRAQRDELAA
jgi:hypothetical protein